MRHPETTVRTLLLAVLSLAGLAPIARAQSSTAPDSGLLVIFDHDTPIAHERYAYQFMGDSLVISAATQREFRDESGKRHPFLKTMVLTVDAHDLGLMRYLSNQDFNDHKTVRGLLPADTVMTYYKEYDGVGDADRLVQPPGRLFVLDPQLFTLFDVLCRSLAGKEFATRRVQLVALAPDTLTMPLAIVTLQKPGTTRVGTRRVLLRHYSLDDHGVRFELWADPRGHMVRMANQPSGLSVELAPESARAVGPKRRAPGRR